MEVVRELAPSSDADPAAERELGERWQDFLGRQLRWKMACERTVFFAPGEAEQGSVLSNPAAFEAAVRRSCRRS